ncbi:MAG: Rossmann-like domain-containing protein [Caldisericum exile]|uniref:Rossmann-like domain-containing protein n=1 Tax=Caldisericum exile TaxID=693075 RepID=UPI003C75EEBC
MDGVNFYEELKIKFKEIVKKHNIENDKLSVIFARPLLPKEAIGEPMRKDFPLLKGKEFMIEATFRQSKGQAFTDSPSNFEGTVFDLLEMSLLNNSERAIFIASLNAIMRHFGYIANTVHCKNDKPEICAERLSKHIEANFVNPKIAFIGYQPAMVSRLSQLFEIKVIDLDQDNIGKEKSGVKILGPEKTDKALALSDLIIATGSTSVNGSIVKFIGKKPVIFFGVTGASVCALFGLKRFCPCSR